MALQSLIIVLVGCALQENNFGEGRGDPTTEATFSTTEPSLVDTAIEPVPEYYSFETEFTIDDKGSWPYAAVFDVALFGVPDPAKPSEVLRQCTFQALADAEPSGPPLTEDPLPVWSWWRVNLEDGSADTTGASVCGAWPAREWLIGIGAYDPRLDPALASVHLDGRELYGLYLQEWEAGPVYVVGVAGTAAMFAGELGLAVTPLVPGDYAAQSLILLSIP